MKLAFALLTLTLCFSSATAVAQTDRQRTQAPRPQQVDFDEEDLIVGTLQGPDGEVIRPRSVARHSSLIRERTDFRASVLRSANEL